MTPGESENITSPQNPRIKFIQRLHKKRERDRENRILIEGARELAAAIESVLSVEEVLHCPEIASSGPEAALLEKTRRLGAKLTTVSPRAYEKIAYRKSSGGIVAVAKRPNRTLGSLPRLKEPLLLVVEGVEKPGNLGAMFRSADGAGVTCLIVCDPGTDLFNPNVIRSSLGTVFSVPAALSTTSEAISWLAAERIPIIVSTPREGSLPYTGIDMTSACAIVVGSEDTGASAPWLEAADSRIRIPMSGKADSLNVSAAAAILLYEAVRQRNGER